jgi:hypothetical protein
MHRFVARLLRRRAPSKDNDSPRWADGISTVQTQSAEQEASPSKHALAPEPRQSAASVQSIAVTASPGHADPFLDDVTGVLDALIAADTWGETHAILLREQALLLTDEADQLLAARSAQAHAAGEEDDSELLDLHRSLVQQSRIEGVEAAWAAFILLKRQAELNQQHADVPAEEYDLDPQPVAQALNLFLNTKPWEAKWSILDQEQARLLSNTALLLLKSERELANSNVDAEDGHSMMLRLHAWVLWRARQRGNSQAVAEFEALRSAAERAMEERLLDMPLAQTLDAWLKAGTHRDMRRFLLAHLELLTPATERMIQVMLYAALGDTELEQERRTSLAILREAQAGNGTPAAIDQAYVNAYSGLILDWPDWLEAAVLQIGKVETSGRGDQTAAARTTILWTVLEQAQRDPQLAPEVIAELWSALAEALHDDPGQARKEAMEEALRAYERVLPVYTLARYPRQYARIQVNLGETHQKRLAGVERDNVETAIGCYQEALRVYTVDAYPSDFRLAQVELGWLGLVEQAGFAERASDPARLTPAYLLADQAFQQARSAQQELSWLEGDEKGKRLLFGANNMVRELYNQHAFALWQLGRVKEAMVALEAGRTHALAESQALRAVARSTLPPDDAAALQAALQAWEAARVVGDHTQARVERQRLLDLRARVRAQPGHANFLPGEPSWEEIWNAVAPGQALLYVAAHWKYGMAYLLPPAMEGEDATEAPRQPLALELQSLNWQVVQDWLARWAPEGFRVRGFGLGLEHGGFHVLLRHLARLNGSEQIQFLDTPLRTLAERLPEELSTLRTAFGRMATDWAEQARELAGGDTHGRERGRQLEARLALPLRDALHVWAPQRDLPDLHWYFLEAELEELLPRLSDVILQPLRTWLDQLGLTSRNQPIALIACSWLGALPLHAALVRDAHGRNVPFQETCELSYQASARSMATTRASLASLPKGGPVLAVGNPQPTNAAPLEWAEAEAEAIVELAHRAGRMASRELVTHDATKDAVLSLLRELRMKTPGAWVEMATHGHADPIDPGNCYMLLAGIDARANPSG